MTNTHHQDAVTPTSTLGSPPGSASRSGQTSAPTWRSNRPGRVSAVSRSSGRLVAAHSRTLALSIKHKTVGAQTALQHSLQWWCQHQ